MSVINIRTGLSEDSKLRRSSTPSLETLASGVRQTKSIRVFKVQNHSGLLCNTTPIGLICTLTTNQLPELLPESFFLSNLLVINY